MCGEGGLPFIKKKKKKLLSLSGQSFRTSGTEHWKKMKQHWNCPNFQNNVKLRLLLVIKCELLYACT